MKRAVLAALLASACTQDPGVADENAGERLERAAIATGVVHDPAATDIAGLYVRDTDRLCIVPGQAGYRIGMTVDYGGGQSCSASGTVARSGETLDVDLGGGCSFNARMDGNNVAFPGRLPADCDRFCTERASLTAFQAELQSDAVAEASALRDAKGKPLCGS